MPKFSNFIFTKASNELLTDLEDFLYILYVNSLQYRHWYKIQNTGYRIQDVWYGIQDREHRMKYTVYMRHDLGYRTNDEGRL